jgi:hypothetical protein
MTRLERELYEALCDVMDYLPVINFLVFSAIPTVAGVIAGTIISYLVAFIFGRENEP